MLEAVVEDSMNEFANSDLKFESEEQHSPLHSKTVPTHSGSRYSSTLSMVLGNEKLKNLSFWDRNFMDFSYLFKTNRGDCF